MPTIISSSSFSVNFDLTTSPGTLVLVDTFNYGAAGIPLAGTSVLDCFTVTAPDGNVFYSNSNFANPGADIVVPSGTTNVNTINLPVLPSGAPVPGVYTIVMTTQITDGVHASYFVTTKNTINFTFVAPTISITQTVDCIGANFTSSDTTDYVVNGVAPVVVRTHDVYVPGNVASPYSSPQPIVNLTSGQFYNGLQTTTITSVCTWTFSNGSTVTATLTGTKAISVDCTYFCAIYCCLRSINSNILKYKGINDMLASQYEATFAKVMGLVELATLAYSCGKSKDVAGYVAQIQYLADCTDDCSCQDGSPSPVYGLGGGGTGVNILITSCNAGITTSSSTVGNTTTWEICLDPILLNKISGLQNTVVVAGDSSVTVTPSGPVGPIPTMTYSIVSNVVEPDLLAFKCTVDYTTVLPVVTVTYNNLQTNGTLFQAPSTITSVNYGTPTWSGLNNYFQFNNFLVTSAGPNKRYKVFATLEPKSALRTTSAQFYSRPRYFEVEILNTQSLTGQVYFRLISASGTNVGLPVTNQNLVNEKFIADIHFFLITY